MAEISERMQKRLDNDFRYHAPRPDQPSKYEEIRRCAKGLAETIVKLSPESREQSVALTHLDAVVFFTNAAIARSAPEETTNA